MPFRVRHNRVAHFTHGLTVVLLAAFMLRALIPTGWMPQASGSDGVTLVICTVAGLQEITLGPDGHPAPADESSQVNAGHDPCPFASAAKFAPPGLIALLQPPPVFVGVAPAVGPQTSPAATHLRLALSRAPPVLG